MSEGELDKDQALSGQKNEASTVTNKSVDQQNTDIDEKPIEEQPEAGLPERDPATEEEQPPNT